MPTTSPLAVSQLSSMPSLSVSTNGVPITSIVAMPSEATSELLTRRSKLRSLLVSLDWWTSAAMMFSPSWRSVGSILNGRKRVSLSLLAVPDAGVLKVAPSGKLSRTTSVPLM